MSDRATIMAPWEAADIKRRARPRPMAAATPPSAEEINRRLAVGIVRATMQRLALAARPAAMARVAERRR